MLLRWPRLLARSGQVERGEQLAREFIEAPGDHTQAGEFARQMQITRAEMLTLQGESATASRLSERTLRPLIGQATRVR